MSCRYAILNVLVISTAYPKSTNYSAYKNHLYLMSVKNFVVNYSLKGF